MVIYYYSILINVLYLKGVSLTDGESCFSDLLTTESCNLLLVVLSLDVFILLDSPHLNVTVG